MGNETILYYVTEEFVTGSRRMAKDYFWRKIKLPSFVVEEDNITVVTIMIPDLKKGWKKEKLLRQMQEAALEYPMYSGNAQVLLQPEVQRILSEKDAAGTISHIEWHLAEAVLKETLTVKNRKTSLESVVFLLGNTLFLEEQMEKFMEMMQSCFPRINHLLILYKPDEEDWQEQSRWEEVVYEYTQEIYYEYGLVTQVQNKESQPLKKHSVRIGQGGSFFLDFGYPETLPLRALQAGDFYLDVFSSEMKSALFRRKYMEISYASPRKYLDTIVKSGYDKLVNRALCQKITRENKT